MGAYKLVHRAENSNDTIVRIGNVDVGGEEFIVAAGPCAIESRQQIMETAAHVTGSGAQLLRGGAFKPRTSPYAFQGLGSEGLELLEAAGRATNTPTVTEVLTPEDIPVVAQSADALQVGARNMQNFALLKALGSAGKPVLLKRGLSSTVEEFLLAAEYIIAHGNPNVVLCERGIRTFETATRNTLDLGAVALLKNITHLPVFVDPSHGTGRRELVTPMAKAAAAAGADGLIIEVHPDPDKALCDGPQSLTPVQFRDLMSSLRTLLPCLGRTLGMPEVTARR